MHVEYEKMNNSKVYGVTFTVIVGLGVISGGITWAVLARNSITAVVPPYPPQQYPPAPLYPPSPQYLQPSQYPPPPSPPLYPPAQFVSGIVEELELKDWWETIVLYQIHVRSFRDSDGDGIGDLKGVIERMDHFVELGVNVIWLSPIFKSPMVDFGYDVSDFFDIQQEYGTLDDFEKLVAKAHRLGLKVLLDFVANHASTKSQMFLDSVKRKPGFEDFFIWSDGLPDPKNASNRLRPTNWVNLFAGSMWTWHNERKQFYLHQFAPEQADFNYRNPAVRKKAIEIMKYWLDKGIDGFRLDAVAHLVEVEPDSNGRYPDNPVKIDENDPSLIGNTSQIYTKDLLESYDIVFEWREFIDKYNENNGGYTRVLFSEAYANITSTVRYYGSNQGRRGAHLAFNFDFIFNLGARSDARDFTYSIRKWFSYMPYGHVPNWVFGNHDNHRIPTRFRESMVDGLISLAMILPGVAVTYQGEEIGMKDGYISWKDTTDILACHWGTPERYMLFNRDASRTPFQWDDSNNAGFSNASKTWLPIGLDYKEVNLAKQKKDLRSHFKVYQKLTGLRKEKTLSHGKFDVGTLTDNTLYLVRYLKSYDTLALVFNLGKSSERVRLDWVPHLKLPATVYTSSIQSSRREGTLISNTEVTLVPGEAIVLRSEPVSCM